MHYYGTRLSENISRREPEGYLLCLNVPVARTGIQEYLPEELGLDAAAAPALIPVLRPEEEVFSPETVASFEGMPVTDGHPPEGVDASNIRALQKGHAHNVRRGTGEEADLLLADLIITDPSLASAVLDRGKREISCGYTYELCREGDGYVQRKIRGNHVAVVDAGRAGPRVCIKDDLTERRKKTMKKSLSKILARMARDGDTETVAEIIGEMIGPEEETAPAAEEPAEAAPEATEETKNIIIDEDGLAGILERLDRVIALLEPAAADSEPGEETAEALGEALEAAVLETADPVAGQISAVMEELLDPAADECNPGEEEPLLSGDALRGALAVVRPMLARLPKQQRRKVAADISARLRTARGRGTGDGEIYQALASAHGRAASAPADLGRRIMEKRNPNYRR